MDISDTLINNANFSRLDLYILGPGSLKEGVSRFTEIITEDKVLEIAEKPEVSNSKEENKRPVTLRREKKDAWSAACFSASRICGSFTTEPISGLSAFFASTSSGSAWSTMPVLCLFALFASTESAGSDVPVPYFSTLFASARSARSAGLMIGLSAMSAFALSVSAVFAFARSTMLVPNFFTPSAFAPSAFAPFASSRSAVLVSSLFASATPVFGLSAFFRLVVTSTLGRQKLIKLNRREKRARLEKLALVFIFLLSSKPLLFFPASHIGKKRSFNKAFDINSWSLAKNQFGEDVDLSFTGCQYLSTVKANRAWQLELLNAKTVYMIEAISLAIAIF